MYNKIRECIIKLDKFLCIIKLEKTYDSSNTLYN